jgi:hypothetical protein
MKSLQVCWAILGLWLALPNSSSAAFVATGPAVPINAIPGGALTVGDKQFSNFALDGFAFNGAIPPTPSQLLVQAGTDTVTGMYGLRFSMAYFVTANQILDAILSFQVSVIPPTSNMRITGTTLTLSAPSLGGPGSFITIGESVFPTSSTATAPVANLSVSAMPGGNPADQSDTETFVNTPLQTAYIRKDILLYGGTSGVTHMSEFFQYYQQTAIIPVPEPSLIGLGIIGGIGSCWMLLRRKQVAAT